MVVIGTSLKVGTVTRALRALPRSVPLVLVNRDRVALPPALYQGFDVTLLGDCDTVTDWLRCRLGAAQALDQRPHAPVGRPAGAGRDRMHQRELEPVETPAPPPQP